MLQNKLANWQEKQYFLNYIFSDFDFFILEKTKNLAIANKDSESYKFVSNIKPTCTFF